MTQLSHLGLGPWNYAYNVIAVCSFVKFVFVARAFNMLSGVGVAELSELITVINFQRPWSLIRRIFTY
jgi:hypothetical protein